MFKAISYLTLMKVIFNRELPKVFKCCYFKAFEY